MFQFLADVAPEHELVWDCATGSGQAAVPLADHFARVIATDASAQQIANAEPHPQVEYRVAQAEQSGLESHSVDLVTVAQALHWFDVDAFHAEARRVLKPDGIIAVSCYTFLEVAPEIDAIVNRFYFETVGPYWPPERAIIENGYRDLPFPFPQIPAPQFRIEAHWSVEQLTGYLRTWSATQKFIAARGYDPVGETERALRQVWGKADAQRLVVWPLLLRVGRSA
jgi:SAM-dependent methyltransferase